MILEPVKLTVLAGADGLFMKHSAHLGIHTELSISQRDLLTSAAPCTTVSLKVSCPVVVRPRPRPPPPPPALSRVPEV